MRARRAKARRSNWRIAPLAIPQPIPPPSRVWTDDEMDAIRRGYIPWIQDEKWFIFIEENRLFAHRSWTGFGIYEATFAPSEDGCVIESAIVTGDETKYRRSSDETESLTLEVLIASHLLKELMSEEQLDGFDPFTKWEFIVPRVPKELFLPRIVKKADQEQDA
ncbi:MAG: hypothetical protein F4Y05_04420 [Acidimicrobiaceae bacterium]|nr:hypothetical protein [Acidimicrobiaceae bacterium]MYE08830.1 hypothetical protein [Acidimicrobiaceae bacterium]MYI35108.1 hypothetical protein [Acidimicrobiaceae bacterium]